jgi:hypothetical protein
MNIRFIQPLFFCFLLLISRVIACPGNEYWQDDPKGVPVWTSRLEIEVGAGASAKIDDTLLRTALVQAGLHPCSDVERDLVDADVRRAIRTAASPIDKQRRWSNYREVTQIMIRHRQRGRTAGVLEIMTRTKLCFDRSGRFSPASPEYQADAVALASAVAAKLNALLPR